jgi:hypothetical protein
MDHGDAMRILKAITTAFDEHDLDGIMVHFADGCLRGPRDRGPARRRRGGPSGFRALFRIPISGTRTMSISSMTAGLRMDPVRDDDRRTADRGPRV